MDHTCHSKWKLCFSDLASPCGNMEHSSNKLHYKYSEIHNKIIKIIIKMHIWSTPGEMNAKSKSHPWQILVMPLHVPVGGQRPGGWVWYETVNRTQWTMSQLALAILHFPLLLLYTAIFKNMTLRGFTLHLYLNYISIFKLKGKKIPNPALHIIHQGKST